MAKYDVDKYLEFISKHVPRFEKKNDGIMSMFSIPTQWIEANNIEELLNRGIEADEARGGKSYIRWMIDKLESPNIIPIPIDFEEDDIGKFIKKALHKDNNILKGEE
jgi:hypothetical protein